MIHRLHPRNRDFHWAPAAPTGHCLGAEQISAWNDDGAFVLRGALTAERCAEVIAAIDPLDAEAEAFLRNRPDGSFGISRAGEITFSAHLVKRAETLRALSHDALLCGAMRDLIGADVRLYWDQAVYKKPGTRDEFPWHQDNGYTFVEPQQYVTCWIALTPATVANGCPWIVPGLHRLGTLEHRMTRLGFRCLEDPEDALPLELAAGDVAVFSSLTPHRTGPNRSADVRRAYILQYAPDGARAVPRDGGDELLCNDPERQFPVVVAGSVV